MVKGSLDDMEMGREVVETLLRMGKDGCRWAGGRCESSKGWDRDAAVGAARDRGSGNGIGGKVVNFRETLLVLSDVECCCDDDESARRSCDKGSTR